MGLSAELVAKVNEGFQFVADFRVRYEAFAEVFGERAEIPENYLNPFPRYDVEKFEEKVRAELVAFIIRLYQRERCPNVEIDSAAVEKQLEGQAFRAERVIDVLWSLYGNQAKELSWREIMKQARRLLPIFWGQGGRKAATVEDILRKDTLRLRQYVSNPWGDRYYVSEVRGFAALGKVVRLAIEGADPVSVCGGLLGDSYRTRQDGLVAFERVEHPEGASIRHTKLFKNGRFDVRFKDEETARKVARALVEDSAGGQDSA